MHWQTMFFLRTLLGLGFAQLIAAFLLLARGRLLPWLIRWSGLRWLGAVSYSGCLYHGSVVLLMHHAVGAGSFPRRTWISTVVLTTFAVSYASHRGVEWHWHTSF